MLGHYKTSPLRSTGKIPAIHNRIQRSPWSGVTPQQMGQLGGELSKVMMEAAAQFMARKALNEVSHAFQEALDRKSDPHPSS